MNGFPLRKAFGLRCSMALTMRPVRTSQLVTHSSSSEQRPAQEHVNTRLSGEKMNARGRECILGENSRFWACRRAVSSSTATVTASGVLIARYLLQGDHTTSLTLKEQPVAKVAESHEVGNPHTTLVKGRACAS